jgi:hypothetical protein
MRRRKGSELATGALVLLAGIVATWGYFWLTAQPVRHRGYPLVVQLTDAGGLERGDRVRLAGVEVGTVRRVGLRSGAVIADIIVDPDLRLPRGSRASRQAPRPGGPPGPPPRRSRPAVPLAAAISRSSRAERPPCSREATHSSR